MYWSKTEFAAVSLLDLQPADARVREQVDVGLDIPSLSDELEEGWIEVEGEGREGQGDEQEQIVPAALGLTQFLTACPDDSEVFQKPERVRAKRAGEWIGNPSAFIQTLLITILASAGAVRLLYFWLKDQAEATWGGSKGAGRVPLIQLTVRSQSPAVWVLDCYKEFMLERPDERLFLLAGFLSRFSVEGGYKYFLSHSTHLFSTNFRFLVTFNSNTCNAAAT